VDFCVTKGIPPVFAAAQSCLDQSSDHSPVLVALTSHAINQEKQPSLSNRSTNWDYFRHLINQRSILNVPLKTDADTEAAVKSFNDTVQWAGWKATPKHTAAHKIHDCPITNKKSQKKEDSAEAGTDYEHQRVNDYLTQQPSTSNNSSIGTETIASKYSCKVLHQRNPPTIPCGRRPKKLNVSRNLLHHLGHP
jgi:hypothetical protein